MTEIELSKALGVTRRRLIDMRKGLQEGLHWSADNKAVQYTAEGIKALKAQLCVPTVAPQRDTTPPIQEAGEKSQAKNTPPPHFVDANNMVADEVVTVRVVKKPMNPKILFCERVENRPSATEMLVVRVVSNENFIPGMDLKAKPMAKGPWVMVGRCPRFRGKY